MTSPAMLIVEKWIKTSTERGSKFSRNKIMFWRARDVLENRVGMSKERYDEMMDLIMDKIDHGNDKTLVFCELKAKMMQNGQ